MGRARGRDVLGDISGGGLWGSALEAGATRLHGAALGIGERCGNTPIDLLMVNLVMMGYRDNDLTGLPAYVQARLPVLDRRDPMRGERRTRYRGGRRAADVPLISAWGRGDSG